MTTHITINEINEKVIKRDMVIVDDMIYLDNPIYISANVKKMFGMELVMFFEDAEANLEMINRMRELYCIKRKGPELFTGQRFDMLCTAVNQEIKDLEINGGVEIVAFDA